MSHGVRAFHPLEAAWLVSARDRRGRAPQDTTQDGDTAMTNLRPIEKALAELSDAEWMQFKSDEDRRRADQHIIRDLAKQYRELRKIDPEPARD
jgi:hypothetical protein